MKRIRTLQEVRREHIKQVLLATKGDLQHASRILGITPQGLRKIMKRDGLQPGQDRESSELTPIEE